MQPVNQSDSLGQLSRSSRMNMKREAARLRRQISNSLSIIVEDDNEQPIDNAFLNRRAETC